MNLVYNKEEFYRAHLARDSRFDGQFFVAVKTTMIYCRPICPARKAQLKNLESFIHAAQAEEAGFRPCRRCRPETAPGSTAKTRFQKSPRAFRKAPLSKAGLRAIELSFALCLG